MSIKVNQTFSYVGRLGEPLKLNCPAAQYADQIRWTDYVYNTDKNPILICDSWGNTDRKAFKAHPKHKNFLIKEDFSLTILTLTKDAYGLYFCEVKKNNVKTTYQFKVSYIGNIKCPRRIVLRENENKSLPCEIDYGSELLIEMNWRNMNSQIQASQDKSEIKLFRKDLELSGTPELDEHLFKCEAQLGDVEQNCSTRVIVKYSIRDVKILPGKEILDEVVCVARGNPRPKYIWLLNDVQISTGSRLQIQKDWLRESIKLTCQARSSDQSDPTVLYDHIVFEAIETTTHLTSSDIDQRTTPKISESKDQISPLSKCESHQAMLLKDGKNPLPGMYIPQCSENGSYFSRQCHASTGQCWCVDEEGEEIAGTRSFPGDNPPECKDESMSATIMGGAIGAILIIAVIIIAIIITKKNEKSKLGGKQFPSREPDMLMKLELNGKDDIDDISSPTLKTRTYSPSPSDPRYNMFDQNANDGAFSWQTSPLWKRPMDNQHKENHIRA